MSAEKQSGEVVEGHDFSLSGGYHRGLFRRPVRLGFSLWASTSFRKVVALTFP